MLFRSTISLCTVCISCIRICPTAARPLMTSTACSRSATPEDNLAGHDRQLETAVREVMKELKPGESVAKRAKGASHVGGGLE